MKTIALSESTVRRRAKRKGMCLQKGRSSPPYRKPFRVVEATTLKILYGTVRYGQSLAECAEFLKHAMPRCEDIKARLRRLDACKAKRSVLRTVKRGFKNVRSRKVWKGINFVPVAESTLFEIEGTTMPTAPFGDIFFPHNL